MVEKEQKIRLENIESRPRVHHFFVVDYLRAVTAVTTGYGRCTDGSGVNGINLYIYTFHR